MAAEASLELKKSKSVCPRLSLRHENCWKWCSGSKVPKFQFYWSLLCSQFSQLADFPHLPFKETLELPVSHWTSCRWSCRSMTSRGRWQKFGSPFGLLERLPVPLCTAVWAALSNYISGGWPWLITSLGGGERHRKVCVQSFTMQNWRRRSSFQVGEDCWSLSQ